MPDKGLPERVELRGATIFDRTFPLPTVILLRDELEHNIATMAAFCASHGVALAPHGKTTMSPELIGRQLAAGAWAITVATAWQAWVVAGMGVRRLILANEVVDPGSLRLLDALLASHDDLEILCYADSLASLESLEAGIDPAHRTRLRVLVELGVVGGRTGLRDDGAALALARRVAAGPLPLAGFSAFEGIVAAPTLAESLALVDGLLDRLATAARAALDLVDEQPIVTVGGSAYFDRVVAKLPAALHDTPYRTVLRSGCYLTHDSLSYEELSPFGARPRLPYRLRPALQVWAAVLSRPEPGLALAGLGRRDASADAGLPIPLVRRDRGGAITTVQGTLIVMAINDQHAYLSVPEEHPLAVGDLVGFGISHPCTTFDKWHAIPIVDPAGLIVEVARTYF